MTVNDFLDLVRRSQLVEEDQLTKFLGALSARNGGKLPETPDKAAAEMVGAKLLTEWQSAKLLAGKFKGFFLGQYKLLGDLGKRTLGQTYLALHVTMKRLVEIWVLGPRYHANDKHSLGFRDDAHATARLRGVSLLQDYNCDVSGNVYYIVMEHKAS